MRMSRRSFETKDNHAKHIIHRASSSFRFFFRFLDGSALGATLFISAHSPSFKGLGLGLKQGLPATLRRSCLSNSCA